MRTIHESAFGLRHASRTATACPSGSWVSSLQRASWEHPVSPDRPVPACSRHGFGPPPSPLPALGFLPCSGLLGNIPFHRIVPFRPAHGRALHLRLLRRRSGGLPFDC